ncbi:hypothetical protein PTTG_05339 [Puccinia triticina 1-1 BBBD Race 1]|uniref:C3H1-type domain-containing protein n=2 Tax=Puccinia triticina TaxID=208348 RepID=A0A180H1Z4_PUCT1|nr:uncharacterized protein PtA15_5A625 [Puccinia triticina]OAV98801.1 hypothetical protein PTTG_05339 [Puccinia triticina 1-1 BBBD Race 1]WAQ85051.1 hypothetical protein PtA15_5A625 [Puccinia triticina]WAR58385.1 hypothetical protein PtB15_5B619 [Puccinia triticina]
MSRPEIVMQTPAAKKLEAEVQRKLAEYSYSTADDVVMAEYVVVMLANAKTPEQITAELSELIGEDMYDPAFTTWLFEEVARQYGMPQTTSNPPLSPSDTQDKLFTANDNNNNSNDNHNNNSNNDAGDKIQTVNDSRDHQMNYNRGGPIKRAVHPTNSNRPITHPNPRSNQPGGVFNQAVTGIKRSGTNDIIRDTPPHRRLRQDDYPSGPLPNGPRSSDRNPRDQHWSNGMMSDRRDLPNGQRPPSNFPIGHPMGADSAAKSILERVGVSVNPNHPFQNPGFPRGYDQQMPPSFRRPNDIGHNNGTAPSQQQMFYGSPSSYPLPILPSHPFSQQHFHPHNSPNGPTPQLFLANGQPYIPSHPFQIPGSGPNPINPYPFIQHPSPTNQSKKSNPSAIQSPATNSNSKAKNQQQQQHPHQQSLENRVGLPAQQAEPALAPLPSVPLLREECKYNLACKNAWCPSSHCSPKGHPKSSMLLSFFPCELQLKCTDPECLKAHVSPQQADPKSSIKPGSMSSKPGAQSGLSMGPGGRGQAGTPNGKSIPCRFGSQCTRSDCVFTHPWIVNGGLDRSAGDESSGMKNAFIPASVPCKFGLQCTRPDCFYQHPSSHRGPSKNISKSFINNHSSAKPAGAAEPPTVTGLASTEKLSPSKKFSAPVVDAPTNGTAAHHQPDTAPGEQGDEKLANGAASSPKPSDLPPAIVPSDDTVGGSANPTNAVAPSSVIQPNPSTPIPA